MYVLTVHIHTVVRVAGGALQLGTNCVCRSIGMYSIESDGTCVHTGNSWRSYAQQCRDQIQF